MEWIKTFTSRGWRPVVGLAIIISILAGLLLFHLSGPTGLASHSEKTFIAHSFSFKDLVNNPVHLPLRFSQFVFSKALGHSLWVYRLSSALLGALIAITFYFLLRQLFTWRMSLFSTALAISSPWFLSASHSATPAITFALLTIPLALLVWLRSDHSKQTWAWLGLCLSAGLILYVPGMVWLVLPTIFLLAGRKEKVWSAIPASAVILGVVLFGLVCTPLILGIIHSRTSLLAIAGLPSSWPNWSHLPQNLVSAPVQLLFKSRLAPDEHLGHIPFLSIFCAVLASLGTYLLVTNRSLDRYKFVVSSGVLFSLLYGLGGPVNLLALLPASYLLVSTGLNLALGQWFTVFPRNPVARKIGIALIGITVLFGITYNLINYFVAWPHDPNTIAAFQQK